eukprot:CAMPEP_0184690934 /NCGR_PEP_ID=MMETSP0312-20130426/31521_1 /TAXON_ID=31354 /ORGANISM="Compsopogon coeruleus, Strain SAG 36.94" /LENGTH=68 /DNA_ID=CAMNT_0027148515 /DNA_START=652 /DNA_END=858 /DNA_ORIENTATION=-
MGGCRHTRFHERGRCFDELDVFMGEKPRLGMGGSDEERLDHSTLINIVVKSVRFGVGVMIPSSSPERE